LKNPLGRKHKQHQAISQEKTTLDKSRDRVFKIKQRSLNANAKLSKNYQRTNPVNQLCFFVREQTNQNRNSISEAQNNDIYNCEKAEANVGNQLYDNCSVVK
jgi:hypothetical protein